MTDNMKLWSAVEKTDPAYTKHVAQRGGFTAISANYQIMQATKQFGPVGVGWGYATGDPIFHETLLFVPVTLWHGDRSNTFGPMLGCEEWKDSKGRIDSDASKKATTDAITKLLSHLGFSADVFLGKYDDQKYVAELKKEFSEVQLITDEQRDEIAAMLDGLGVSVVLFCQKAKIKSIKEIPADKFESSKAWIFKKSEQQKEAA